jgi:hypothetical protein
MTCWSWLSYDAGKRTFHAAFPLDEYLLISISALVALGIGPLRQAFILFNHVSGYTAGFGRFWMSARRLKSVYSVV